MLRSYEQLPDRRPEDGYILVIAEKPDAARRIATSIGKSETKKDKRSSIEFYAVRGFDGKNYVICSALGHLYTVAPAFKEREIYPILDIEWLPTYLVEKKRVDIKKRLDLIYRLSTHASSVIIACDYDLEGETIGYNILRYDIYKDGIKTYRAKFSTLTKEDLQRAFSDLTLMRKWDLAYAGRTRHALDFLWGVNLSRFLTESLKNAKGGYGLLSIGRVQGPTLSSIYKREIDIRTFVTLPYWVIEARGVRDGNEINLYYEERKVLNKAKAEELRKLKGSIGKVITVKKSITMVKPPTPYNLGDMQKDAYRVFGFTPKVTLNVAERLYLSALISYPRTSSQKLPPDINYRRILTSLKGIKEYSSVIGELLDKPLRPVQGKKDDPAHPAIYPTGEMPNRNLSDREIKLYDLISSRFIATFMEPAKRQGINITIDVDGYKFKASGRRTVKPGWLKIFGKYVQYEDVELPELEEGDEIKVIEVTVREVYDEPPPRYNQASLLTWMEKENIGTKATRADIISTLYDRGYIIGGRMELTDLGFSVVETLLKTAPKIMSVSMTKEIEESLNAIELGKVASENVLEKGVEQLIYILRQLNKGFTRAGELLYEGYLSSIRRRNILGNCPVCNTGKLTVIRSRRTGKRFVGCTGYKDGCRASAPLPAHGLIKTTNRTCPHCGWPIILVIRKGRRPWSLCINVNCPSKVKRG